MTASMVHVPDAVEGPPPDGLVRSVEAWAAAHGYRPGVRGRAFGALVTDWRARRVCAVAVALEVERRTFVRRTQPHRDGESRQARDFTVDWLDPWSVEVERLKAESREVVGCVACDGKGGVPCPACEGRASDTCGRCGGSGVVERALEDGTPQQYRCRDCKGSGRLACERCGGQGRTTCALCAGAGAVEQWWSVDHEAPRETRWVFADDDVTPAEKARLEAAFRGEPVGVRKVFEYTDKDLFEEDHQLPPALRKAVAQVLDAQAAEVESHRDRVRSHRVVVLELWEYEGSYEVQGRRGGLRFIGDDFHDEGSDPGPLAAPSREGRLAAWAPAALAGSIAFAGCALYAARGPYFRGDGLIAMAAMAAAATGLLALWGRAAQAGAAAGALWRFGVPAAAAALLAGAVTTGVWREPRAERALARAQAGDWKEAQREIAALREVGRGDTPQTMEALGAALLAEARATADENTRLLRLDAVPPDASMADEARQMRDALLVGRAQRDFEAGRAGAAAQTIEALSNEGLNTREARALADRVHLRAAETAFAEGRLDDGAGHLDALGEEGAARSAALVVAAARGRLDRAAEPGRDVRERYRAAHEAARILDAHPERFAGGAQLGEARAEGRGALARLRGGLRLIGGPADLAAMALADLDWRRDRRGAWGRAGASLAVEAPRTAADATLVTGLYLYDWGDDGRPQPGLAADLAADLVTAAVGEAAAERIRAELLRAGDGGIENRLVMLDGEVDKVPAVVMLHDGVLRGLTLGQVEP